MKHILLLLLILSITGCEIYYVNHRDLTLSGKYVVSALDITYVDQSIDKDTLYRVGSTYLAKGNQPQPFDSIVINRFYLHFDYSTVRMNILRTDPTGRDIWEYGNTPNEIFYQVWGNNAFSYGYLRFSYFTRSGEYRTVLFLIEEDGFESLQLRSSGTWVNGKEGQKEIMTLYLTRVGP